MEGPAASGAFFLPLQRGKSGWDSRHMALSVYQWKTKNPAITGGVLTRLKGCYLAAAKRAATAFQSTTFQKAPM